MTPSALTDREIARVRILAFREAKNAVRRAHGRSRRSNPMNPESCFSKSMTALDELLGWEGTALRVGSGA